MKGFKVQRFQDDMVEHLFSLGFSCAEIMILDIVVSGDDLSAKQIADKLFVSWRTVQFHLTNIYKNFEIVGNKGSYKKVQLVLKLKEIFEKNGFKMLKDKFQ